MDPLLQALRCRYSDRSIADALSSAARPSERNRALRRWETGLGCPDLPALRRLAAELQCELVIGDGREQIAEVPLV